MGLPMGMAEGGAALVALSILGLELGALLSLLPLLLAGSPLDVDAAFGSEGRCGPAATCSDSEGALSTTSTWMPVAGVCTCSATSHASMEASGGGPDSCKLSGSNSSSSPCSSCSPCLNACCLLPAAHVSL